MIAADRQMVTELEAVKDLEVDPLHPPVVLNAPMDRALASLWELAQLEFEAQGKAAATKDDWRAVGDRYHALLTERRNDLGHLIHEVGTPALEPVTPRLNIPAPQLRQTLTPFGRELALALLAVPADEAVTINVISPAEAVQPMRALLERLGLESKKQLSGTTVATGPTWAEEPAVFIRQWAGPESLIMLKEDADGPAELSFDTRLSADTVKVVYRIGDALGHAVRFRAFWDIGIRRSVWAYHVDRTPKNYVERAQARYSAIPGCVLTFQPRDAEWVEYVLALTERP